MSFHGLCEGIGLGTQFLPRQGALSERLISPVTGLSTNCAANGMILNGETEKQKGREGDNIRPPAIFRRE